ncbi:MAG: right-handed parallel beta-helix repeat-containing protein [Planctomycetia bacterium]|nr:right-handed parallel beta-helix repeat-containing protein [Planctomycetia bacterium]
MFLRKNRWYEDLVLTVSKIFFLVCFFSGLNGLNQEVMARDIFVDNIRGNDEFTGWNTAINADGNGPVRTIRRALELARAGDRIVLAKNEEPYRESVTFIGKNHSGALSGPFILEGNGAILDGSVEINPELWKFYGNGIFYFRPKYIAYQNLFLNGKPLSRAEVPGHEIPEIKLERMQWCMHEGNLLFKPEREHLPGDFPLRCAGMKCGITLIHVEGVEIRDLIVQGFQHDGIAAANSARNVFLNRVKLRGNARAGLSVGGACSVWIMNSVLGDNNAVQLWTERHSRTEIKNSELLSNTAAGWLDHGGVVMMDGKEIKGGLDERERFRSEENQKSEHVEVSLVEKE